ncbi:MAG: ABC transporter ATP-binding protein [Desulfobacteraceae bacterium]|nr:MAG: ABC transporter ATP-binding protein [Desulfobacteraceae bacterium]
MLKRILGKEIAHYVRANRRLVVLALVLITISSLFAIIPVALIKPFIDEGMKSGTELITWKLPWLAFQWQPLRIQLTEKVLVENISPNRLLVLFALIGFGATLIRSITQYLGELTTAAFSNRTIQSVRIDLFQKYLSLPLAYYHKSKTGELISRSTADLTVMQERIANILIGLVQQPLTAFVLLIYLFFMNYKLTLLVFIVGPLIIVLVRLFGKKVKKHSKRVQEAVSYVTSAYQETLLCLKVVQGFNMEQKESAKFHVLVGQFYKKIMHWNRWFLGLGPMMDSTVFIVLPAVLIIGKVYFRQSLGEIFAMMYAFSRVYAPVKTLARVNNELRTLQGATERVFGIMKTVPEIQDRPDSKVLLRHKESIEFEKVGFGYDRQRPVLQGVSFKMQAGQMAAFVGSTGAGKSTLLDLIPRFYDVRQGAIRIDGRDIREVTLSSLRSQIGIVNQEVLLFHDTIANNIRYGAPEKGMAEITAAAKAAHAHDFILAQSQGYDSVVGDRGTLLSGGQRQRIAIARAILVDPAILLLDEAASALDAESENLVQEAIFRLRGGRTIMVVAHRLSTIREADCIFVLEKGRIVEQGTHVELLALNGHYRQLHDMQFRA